jgi:hypothetical protein
VNIFFIHSKIIYSILYDHFDLLSLQAKVALLKPQCVRKIVLYWYFSLADSLERCPPKLHHNRFYDAKKCHAIGSNITLSSVTLCIYNVHIWYHYKSYNGKKLKLIVVYYYTKKRQNKRRNIMEKCVIIVILLLHSIVSL